MALRGARAEDGPHAQRIRLCRASKTKQPVAGETEEEIYQALGLAWIPPELRENQGEIEAGRSRQTPEAGGTERYPRRPAHAHHARPTAARRWKKWPRPRARWATNTSRSRTIRRRSPWPTAWMRSARSRSRTRCARWINDGLGLRVFSGLECDILRDGAMDLDDDALAELDFVIGSVHSYMNLEAGGDDGPPAARARMPASASAGPSHRARCCCIAIRFRSISTRWPRKRRGAACVWKSTPARSGWI